MERPLFLDMDGVLADFVGGVNAGGFPWEEPPGGGKFGDLSADTWSKLGYDFWANLKWTEDGEEIVKWAVDNFGKENICLLSAPSHTLGCVEGKRAWIEANIPWLKRQFLFGVEKKWVARNGAWLIDDADKNVIEWTHRGGSAILIPRPWNAWYLQAPITTQELLRAVKEDRLAYEARQWN